MSEANKRILQRAIEEIYCRGKLAVADELVASDCVDHNPMPGQGPGREGVKQVAAMLYAALPDMRMVFDATIAEGDKAAARWTVSATHQGELLGIPATGKPVTITGQDMVRIADGKIVDWWHNEDILGLLQQIGAVPGPGQDG